MELFIVAAGLAAGAGGALVLLGCLAGKHSELLKAFSLQLEQQARTSKARPGKKEQKSPGQSADDQGLAAPAAGR